MSSSAYRIAAMGALALVFALLVSVAAVLIVRGNTNAPIQIIAPSAGQSETGAPGGAGAAPTPQPDVRVYIQGAVEAPGVYPAQPGHRLADLLLAAGGPTEGADLAAVNLAQRLHDEGYYYIPRAGETPPAVATAANSPSSTGAAGVAASGLLDLNTATAEMLMSLPNIGEARARAIVEHRERRGAFTAVEQVMEVSGIGPGIYESIRELVTVGGPQP